VPTFAVTTHREGGQLVVVATGELDIATAGAVQDAAAQREPDEGLVLDLRGLSFLDTSGIQVVIEANRAARDEGFALRILRAAPQVHRVFEIAGLEGVLPFADAMGDGDA
jgi:anti-anti-sigma factor